MPSPPASRNRKKFIVRRVVAGLVALGIAAPAAMAATGSGSAVVHTHIDKSGTVAVSGYDGGVSLTSSTGR